MISLVNIWNSIWKNRTKITFIIMMILIILYWRQCGQMKYERKKADQNQKALTDTLQVVKTKNGYLVTQKATFVASEKELKELNSDLYDEVDEWKRKKSKVKVVVKTEIVYVDNGKTKNVASKIGKNEYKLAFDYTGKDSILIIKGYSDFKAYPIYKNGDTTKFNLRIVNGETVFDTVSVNIELTMGVKEDKDGVDRVFIKPNSEKIKIKDLYSVQMEEFYKSKYNKKKKHFTVGPHIGLGVGVGNGGQFQLIPQVGIGIQYSIFKF